MTEKPLHEQYPLFVEAYVEFIATASNYPEPLQTQVGVCGDWSARDVVAHLNGWLVECLRRLPRFAKGTNTFDYNLDAFNAVSLWLREDHTYDQLLAEMRRLVEDVSQFVEALPQANAERDERYSKWLRILTHDANEHRAELQQFLQVKNL